MEPAFRVFVSREPGYELRLGVRFAVSDGYGVLLLGGARPGHDASPARVYERLDVDPATLRRGRFVHLQGSPAGRSSYLLERLTEAVLQAVPEDMWVELESVVDVGFRYLMVPSGAQVGGDTAGRAAVRVTGPRGDRAAVVEDGLPHELTTEEVPASTGVALDRMTSTELQRRVEALERALAASRSRERDLLELLRKWQEGRS